jgi:DNA topoisomerase-1
MTKLLIVESPAKAKTIEKYLGGEYKVKASVGHIRDLPKSNKNAVDIDGGFVPHYQVLKNKENVVGEIKKLAAKADEVILATDPDREGEAIAWHIKEAAGLKKPKRIVFHEITKDAVQEALKHPREIDEKLRQAQEARRVLDRLFGYDLSGLIWRKLRYGLSAGRVQSPALRILVEREREIKAFVPEKYWVLEALFGTQAGVDLTFTCIDEPKTQEVADTIVELSKKAAWQISDIEQSDGQREPRAPFITSTLQQAASSRLGLSPSMTMRLAQKLYEAGHITYMRTDSTNLSKAALGEIAGLIKTQYGDKYYEGRTYTTKSKSAQEAHEAIRPTSVSKSSVGKGTQEDKLYRLIWSRTVASQMAAAKIKKTKVVAAADNKNIPHFAVSGSVITFDGWLKADPAARGEDVELPKLAVGEPLKLKDIQAIGKETEPPRRYSEARLIKELEKRDIGRPSTYAPIIQTIVARGYVTKENKVLQPTDIGEIVSGFLEQYFAHYISDNFTSEMEGNLDDIADGKKEYVKTLKEFYGPFHKEIVAKKDIPKLTNLGKAPKGIACPKCGGPMVIKLSRGGRFLSCANFPDCEGALTIEGKELATPQATGEKCPDCTEGNLIEREGRFGKFVACAGYPKCKYVEKSEEQLEKEKNGVKCTDCSDGVMIERRGRFGIFYSCSNYPDCKNAIKSKPTGRLCTYNREDGKNKLANMCGHLMMEGTKTIPERCSDKTCPNHNPHKL